MFIIHVQRLISIAYRKKAFLKIDEKNMIIRNGTSDNCVYQGKEEGNFKQIDYFKEADHDYP